MMKRMLLVVISAGALAVIAAAGGFRSIANAQQAEKEADHVDTVTYAIENMTCATCPITVRTAMKRVKGVKFVEVDFKAMTATVVFDSDVATEQEIADASTNAGYPAARLEDGSNAGS